MWQWDWMRSLTNMGVHQAVSNTNCIWKPWKPKDRPQGIYETSICVERMGLVRVTVRAVGHVGSGSTWSGRQPYTGFLWIPSASLQDPSQILPNFRTASIVQHKTGVSESTMVGWIRGSHSGLWSKIDLGPKGASLEVLITTVTTVATPFLLYGPSKRFIW